MTADDPQLDQVSSQALTRLAAERGLTPVVTPAGEDAVRPLRRSWSRFLPYVFFGLSLFALWGMAFGLFALAEGGWSWSDAIQVALMALLVAGVLQQAKGMIRPTRAGRWLAARRTSRAEAVAPVPGMPAYLLDAVSAADLAALRPATAPGVRIRAVAQKTGSRWFERFAVISVVVLAFLAFIGMVFVCGYIAYVAGPWEPGLWLSLPFTALTSFGAHQVFRSARRAAFRGRPWALLTRAFRDSVRVWGSGSLATHTVFTTTAAASIAGAAILPMVAPSATIYDLFLIDADTGSYYRVDLATNTSLRTGGSAAHRDTTGLGSTARAATLADGTRLPAGSIIGILESETNGQQGMVAFRPGRPQPIGMARLSPPLPGAHFSVGGGVVYALLPDGVLWRVDAFSGASTRIAKVNAPAGPIAYDRSTASLYVFGGRTLSQIAPGTGTVTDSIEVPAAAQVEACGIARASKNRLFIAESGTGRILLLNTSTQSVQQLIVTGEMPEHPCAMTLAPRS